MSVAQGRDTGANETGALSMHLDGIRKNIDVTNPRPKKGKYESKERAANRS